MTARLVVLGRWFAGIDRRQCDGFHEQSRNPRDRSSENYVRKKRNDSDDDQRLHNEEAVQHEQLVNRVEDDRDDEDLAEIRPARLHELATIQRMHEERPEKRGLAFACIAQTGADRENARDDRLQNQPEVQRSAGAAEELLDGATEHVDDCVH